MSVCQPVALLLTCYYPLHALPYSILTINLTIRALLDSGSQSSFLSEDTCKQLWLCTKPANLLVTGLNNTASNIKAKCNVTISSQYNAYTTELTCFVIPTVSSDLPSATIEIKTLSIPRNIKLADPAFFKPQKIDMLIGVDLFYNLLCAGQICLGPNKPVLQKNQIQVGDIGANRRVISN